LAAKKTKVATANSWKLRQFLRMVNSFYRYLLY